MDQSTGKRIVAFVLLFGVVGFLGAQNLPAQPFSFRWKPVDGAGAYLTEVKNPDGEVVVSRQVTADQTSMTLSLVPGPYTLRLSTLNRFLKPESATEWVPIHIAATAPPELGDFAPLALHPGDSASVALSVKLLAQDATAALRSPSGTLLPLDVPAPSNGQIHLALPPLSERGAYELVVTNPPKLAATVKGKITVHYPIPVVTLVEPSKMETSDSPQPLRITGQSFSPESIVTMSAGVLGTPVRLELSNRSDSTVTVTLPSGLNPGDYLLAIANAPDEKAVSAGTFTMVAPPPPPIVEAAPPPPVGQIGDPKVEVATVSKSLNGEFSFPTGIASRRFGAVYVSDTFGNAIRAIYPDGSVATFAGSGKAGASNGKGGETAEFNKPTGIVLDSHDNLIVADSGNSLLRKITPEGEVSTLANLPNPPRSKGGVHPPHGLAIDATDTLYVADSALNSILVVTPKGRVTTLAGSPKGGSANGTVNKASFFDPQGIAVDATGSLYIADTGNNLIRKITPDGTVTTLAGSGTAATTDGQGTSADFNGPTGIELGPNGILYVSETTGHRVRQVAPDGTVTTIAGSGRAGTLDGTGDLASFNGPAGLATDAAGTLLLVDSVNNAVRRITLAPTSEASTQVSVSTWAGNGVPSFLDAYGLAAGFNSPRGMTFDEAGNLYVADTGNHCVRKVSVDGTVTTISGTGSLGSSNGGFFFWQHPSYNHPEAVAVGPDGTLYISDTANNDIRKVTPKGEVSVLAGSGRYWSVDGIGTKASFNNPSALAVDGYGTVYVVEDGAGLGRIRKIAPDGRVSSMLPKWAPEVVAKSDSRLSFSASGLAVDSVGDLYVSTRTSPRILRVTTDGLVHVLAGSGTPGTQDGRGTAASFQVGAALALDHFGNLYVADTLNQSVRKVTPDGNVTTLGGDLTTDPWRFPSGVAVSSDGTVYVADTGNHRIRKIDMTAPATDLPSMTLSRLSNQGPLNFPGAVASDASGTLYVIDGNGLYKVAGDGQVSLLAGSTAAGNRDGSGATAQFRGPQALAVDASGQVFVADTGNDALRLVTPQGKVSTLAVGLHHPAGITVNSKNRVFVADTGAGTILEFTGHDKVRSSRPPKAFRVWASGFSLPRAVTDDGRGNLWVADENRIKRIDAFGRVATIAGSGVNGALDGWGRGTSFSTPLVLVGDGKGNVFVADQGYGKVRYVNSEGVVTTLDAAFDLVTGLTRDAQGRVWVADALKQRLEAFVPAGAPSSPSLVSVALDADLNAGAILQRTIKFNAGFEGWGGVQPTLRSNPLEFWPEISGSSPRAFYLAKDTKYLYWLMPLSDGRPRGSNAINYALEIFQGSTRATPITAKIDGWSAYSEPILLRGNARSAQPQVLWRGSVSDRALGSDYIQARFPLDILSNYFASDTSYRIFVHVYRGGQNIPFREGPRLGSAQVQF